MKMLSFFMNYGYNSVIGELHSKESLVINATENVKRLKRLHKQFKKNTEFINLIVECYYNKRYKNILPWKEGDKVYL